jgi:ParB/RepB/Spo0J family partition protein
VNIADVPREFRELPLSVIDEPILPARSQMDERAMQELVDSIRANGLISPIAVARVGERYEVIAGHRRRLASALAGLAVMPAVIYPSKELALEAIKTAENLDREQLNPADEAIYYSELLEGAAGGDVDKLCAIVKRKRAYVEGRLLLFGGDAEVFRKLQAGEISIGVAHELNRCTDEQHRRYFLLQAITGGATITVVRGWVEDWKRYAINPAATQEAVASAAVPAAMPETNFFRCVLCQGDEHVHLMRSRNMHEHCERAILAPFLEQRKRGRSVIEFPRTLPEARALAGELLEAFPELLTASAE